MNTLEFAPPAARREREIKNPAGPELSPLFIADWLNALFIHFEIEACRLQPFIPYPLDLREGRAFVSLVAFTMNEMRFARLGRLGAWLCRPIATHPFLNLRTYVRHDGEPGICFMSEWLMNRLSVLCGPAIYSLPYHYADIEYRRADSQLTGRVNNRAGRFAYEGTLASGGFELCVEGSLDYFLIERYRAFNAGHRRRSRFNSARRCFHVNHEPWLHACAQVRVVDDSLLRAAAPWWPEVRFVGANYSPGVRHVQMSVPRHIR